MREALYTVEKIKETMCLSLLKYRHIFNNLKYTYFNFSKFSGSKLHISSTWAPRQPEIRNYFFRRQNNAFFPSPLNKIPTEKNVHLGAIRHDK